MDKQMTAKPSDKYFHLKSIGILIKEYLCNLSYLELELTKCPASKLAMNSIELGRNAKERIEIMGQNL